MDFTLGTMYEALLFLFSAHRSLSSRGLLWPVDIILTNGTETGRLLILQWLSNFSSTDWLFFIIYKSTDGYKICWQLKLGLARAPLLCKWATCTLVRVRFAFFKNLIYSRHLISFGPCYGRKQIDIIFLCVWPLIEEIFRHNIVIARCCGTFLLTLTMLWRNLSSISGQTHKKPTSLC